MTEETTQTTPTPEVTNATPVATPVAPATTTVTDETITKINNEIQKTETETKDVIVNEVQKSNDALRVELEAIKKQNEEIRRRQEAELEQSRLRAELEKEKNFMNEVNKKHVVPVSENPTAPQPVGEPNLPKKSVSQEWAEFDSAVKRGNFGAKLTPESMVE